MRTRQDCLGLPALLRPALVLAFRCDRFAYRPTTEEALRLTELEIVEEPQRRGRLDGQI